MNMNLTIFNTTLSTNTKLSTNDVVACTDDVNKAITSKLILKIINIFFKKLNPFLLKFKKNGCLRIWLITLLFLLFVNPSNDVPL